jgi:hypothetical protein
VSVEYILRETIIDENWDKFVNNSINGTIFSKSYYLNSLNVKYKLFYCYKKEELRASVAVVESEDKKDLILNDFIIYNGIMYNKPTNKQNHAQQFSEQFKIQAFIAEELASLYTNIELSLHPSIIDIRAFLWVNYGENKPQYKPDIRYTTYLDISDFKDSKQLKDISIYNKASTSRRQQIRYAIKKNYKTISSEDSKLFIEFYEKTMDRQDIDIENNQLIDMKTLIDNLLLEKVAKIYATYDELDEISSMALFGWDNKRAYYIFGASDPIKRNGHSGTAVLWNAFYDLNNMSIDEIDLEGINSPARGWFKLSFGGNIVPYYEIRMEK